VSSWPCRPIQRSHTIRGHRRSWIAACSTWMTVVPAVSDAVYHLHCTSGLRTTGSTMTHAPRWPTHPPSQVCLPKIRIQCNPFECVPPTHPPTHPDSLTHPTSLLLACRQGPEGCTGRSARRQARSQDTPQHRLQVSDSCCVSVLVGRWYGVMYCPSVVCHAGLDAACPSITKQSAMVHGRLAQAENQRPHVHEVIGYAGCRRLRTRDQ
jgi:hypothetical protein